MKFSSQPSHRIGETAPSQVHSLVRHHCRHRRCCCHCHSIAITSLSYSCLRISVHFLQQGARKMLKVVRRKCIDGRPRTNTYYLSRLLMKTPRTLLYCGNVCLPTPPVVVASQFPCIMPPHCCRFRSVPSSRAAPSKFRMTTFVETLTSKVSSSPKVFKSQLTTPPRRLGSFFSHAIPTFSPPNIRFFT